MNRRNIGRVGAIFYLALYSLAILTPRRISISNGTTSHPHFFKRLLHGILYYGGPLEPVANFLLLVPIFLLLPFLSRKIKPWLSLAICSGLAATSEILQIFIPGRFSSIKDFALNSLGALFAYLLHIISTRAKSLK